MLKDKVVTWSIILIMQFGTVPVVGVARALALRFCFTWEILSAKSIFFTYPAGLFQNQDEKLRDLGSQDHYVQERIEE